MLAEATGVPLEDHFVDEITARDAQDRWLILAQGFSSEGVEPTAMLEGILTWQASDWARHFETGPVNEAVEVGDLSVLRTTFPIDAAGEPYHFEPHRRSSAPPGPGVRTDLRLAVHVSPERRFDGQAGRRLSHRAGGADTRPEP